MKYLSGREKVVWEERAGMADFKVYPIHWLFTVCTIGIYFLVVYVSRFYTRYTLTNERLIKESGILKKTRDEIELFRVKDTTIDCGLFQRFVGYGDIRVISTDFSGSFTLENLPDAMERREQIRSMANKSREAKGVRTIISE